MSSTTCKSTYWDKDHDTQEWTELSCTQPGRHSNHRSGERGPAWGSAAVHWSRADMERDTANSTARERRYRRAVEDLSLYSEWLEEAEQTLAHRQQLVADAQRRIKENGDE